MRADDVLGQNTVGRWGRSWCGRIAPPDTTLSLARNHLQATALWAKGCDPYPACLKRHRSHGQGVVAVKVCFGWQKQVGGVRLSTTPMPACAKQRQSRYTRLFVASRWLELGDAIRDTTGMLSISLFKTRLQRHRLLLLIVIDIKDGYSGYIYALSSGHEGSARPSIRLTSDLRPRMVGQLYYSRYSSFSSHSQPLVTTRRI